MSALTRAYVVAGPGLTLAYCNVITIKLNIDQGDQEGDRPHQLITRQTVKFVINILFPPPRLGRERFKWEAALHETGRWSNQTDHQLELCPPCLIFSLCSQIVILLNSEELQHKGWRLLRRVNRLQQAFNGMISCCQLCRVVDWWTCVYFLPCTELEEWRVPSKCWWVNELNLEPNFRVW